MQRDSNPYPHFRQMKFFLYKLAVCFLHFARLLVTTLSLELRNISPQWGILSAQNYKVPACDDLSSSNHVIVVTVCFAATDIYSSFTILTPHQYSLRFISILTDTLSVTHKYFTITTCPGVPTTLYPHYCRHDSTQDCGSGELRYPDPLINSQTLCL